MASDGERTQRTHSWMHQVADIGQAVTRVGRRLHVLKDAEVVEELEALERP